MGFGVLKWFWWDGRGIAEPVTPGPYYPVAMQGFRPGSYRGAEGVQTGATGVTQQQGYSLGSRPETTQTGPAD